MERFTKIAVTLWACAAIALQAWLLRAWAELPWLTLAVVVCAIVLPRIDRRSIALVFAVAYVFPVLVVLTHGVHFAPFAMLWLAAILGVVLPDALRQPWHLPPLWRASLVFAALVVVVSATISIWRETDGAFVTVLDLGLPMWNGMAAPSVTIRWILNVALILLVGILWFDWLLGAGNFDFERVVVTPLLASSIVMSSVSIYQMLVDMRFLNPGVYGSLARATGTMYDGNVAGTIAALWIGGALLWGRGGPSWRRWAGPVAALVNGMAVWASGSRTALLAAVVIVGMSSLALTRAGARVPWRRVAVGAGVVGLLVAAILVVGRANQRAFNPAARVWDTIATNPDPAALANFLWTRNGYGTAAMILFRQSPFVGVGVGSFYGFVGDIGPQVGTVLPPDNAQHWLRHQLTEFGVLGGLGWAIWHIAFAWFVLVPRLREPSEAWIARGILVAFGIISWLGMPGQDAMVAITFWTMAFYYVRVLGTQPVASPLPRWVWRTMGAAVALFAAGTIYMSATTLSMTARARAYDRPFAFGVSRPIPTGPDAGYRRVMSHAVALVTPSSRWLVVRVKYPSTSANRRPLEILVWSGDRTVLKARLTGDSVVEGFVPVKPGERHMLFEMTARREGLARFQPLAWDSGALVTWDFVEYVSGEVKQYSALRSEWRR